jgi:hypothetical protein
MMAMMIVLMLAGFAMPGVAMVGLRRRDTRFMRIPFIATMRDSLVALHQV